MTLNLPTVQVQPDFVVMMASGMIECHEVRAERGNQVGRQGIKAVRPRSGKPREMKVAAEKNSCSFFRIVWPDRDVWHCEEY